jgi:flagellar hook-associated protein 1 FlgK
MGIGLDNALQIAKSAIHTNQYLINVSGQNIANANNPGYTRKIVQQEATTPLTEVSPGSVGTGVKVSEIRRVIDQFLEVQINKNKSEIGTWETVDKYLSQIERIFNNTTDASINGSIDAFWNAWLDLSNNPSDPSARTALLEKSETMTDYFHTTLTGIEDIQKAVDSKINEQVKDINSSIKKIAELNREIYSVEIKAGNHANDLRDQRDKLVKGLSDYLDINTLEVDNKYNIFLNNGTSLVNGSTYSTLVTEGNSDNHSFSSIYWVDSKKSTKIDISDTIKNGSLRGLLDIRDKYLDDYKTGLNKIANSIMQEVNKAHSQGAGLEKMTSITGTVTSENTEIPFNAEGLAHPVSEGNFAIIVYDSNGNPSYHNIAVGSPNDFDTKVNSLEELKDEIDSINNISAKIVNNKLIINADSGYGFAFADDSSGITSALGLNTFFKGENYNLNKTINISASEETGNTNHLYSVDSYKENILSGDSYKVEFSGGKITITNTSKGKTVSDYKTSSINNNYTLTFDGIRMQFDTASKPSDGNIYYVDNVTSSSVIDEDNFSDHTLEIDFSKDGNDINIFDVNDNLTLSDNDYSVDTVTLNGTSYNIVKIDKYGISVTLKQGNFGVVKINPEITAGKNFESNINNINKIAAAKVQTPQINDNDANIKVDTISITNQNVLTTDTYTIIANGNGTYSITNQDGDSVSPTAESNTSVTVNGIKIDFANATQASDKYILSSNKNVISEGDNRNALEIADLRDSNVLDNGTKTISENMGEILTKVGLDRQNAKNRLEAVNIQEEGLAKQKDNVSGVSIDEEMTKLIQIQHSYTASAKLLSVVDSLLNNLMNSLR